MQIFTQKYAIIQLFEDVQDGYEFTSDNWPLHSTIIDTFAIDWDVSTIISELEKIVIGHKSISTTAIGDKCFGSEQQIKVTLLNITSKLNTLHYDIIKLLNTGGLRLNDPQYAINGFLPHVTVQDNTRINIGDKVILNSLSLIDMFPNQDPYKRKVIETIAF
jgi:2'-5' RNA ligase